MTETNPIPELSNSFIVDNFPYIVIVSVISVLLFILYYKKETNNYKKEITDLDNNLKSAENKSDSIKIIESYNEIEKKHYNQSLLQHKMTFITTLIIATIGFVSVLAGVYIFLDQKENRSVGVLTSIVGIIIELISVLFFSQNNKAKNQLNENHNKLDATRRMKTAIALTLSSDICQNEKNTLIKNIVTFLLTEEFPKSLFEEANTGRQIPINSI